MATCRVLRGGFRVELRVEGLGLRVYGLSPFLPGFGAHFSFFRQNRVSVLFLG